MGKKGFASDETDHGILGAIIVLRAMLTFLIHWEIGNEKRKQENCRSSRGYKIKKGEMIPKKNHSPFLMCALRNTFLMDISNGCRSLIRPGS